MIVRYVDQCPECGQWDPWRQYSRKLRGLQGNEVLRKYVRCKRCGHRDVITFRIKSDPQDMEAGR